MEDTTHTGTGATRTSTTVDLGEDLLERTNELPDDGLLARSMPIDQAFRSVPLELPIPSDQVADQLESARILLSEGMAQDAKRILRRIILSDPSCVSARKRLEEIHEDELKRIFNETPDPRVPEHLHRVPERSESEALMRELDRDLGLGVFGADVSIEADPLASSLFVSRREMESFADKLDLDLCGLSAADRMDVGVAFLEMGLAELAVRQFQAAIRDEDSFLPGTALLASALLQAGRAFEASIALQPVIADSELSPVDKLHFAYLMGQASERLEKAEHALGYYSFVHEIDGGYRDVADRIKFLLEHRPGKK